MSQLRTDVYTVSIPHNYKGLDEFKAGRDAPSGESCLKSYYKDMGTLDTLDKKTMNDYFVELRQADIEFWELVYGESPSVVVYWIGVAFPALYETVSKSRYKTSGCVDMTDLPELQSLRDSYLSYKHRLRGEKQQRFEMLLHRMAENTVAVDGTHLLWSHVVKVAREGKRPSRLPLRNFQEYAKKILRKDRQIAELRNLLIRANLRLALKFAVHSDKKNYGHLKMWRADFIQYSNLGLIEAVNRFDPKREFAFSTYAQHWIRACLLRGQANSGKTIRLSSKSVSLLHRLQDVRNKYQLLYNRRPTDQEILEEIKVKPYTLRWLRQSATKTAYSLNEPVTSKQTWGFGEDMEQITYQDLVEDAYPIPEEKVEYNDWVTMLREVLEDPDLLDQRESLYIQTYFHLIPEEVSTLKEIGDKYGLSRERVRQIINRGLSKMRERMLEHKLVKEDGLEFLNTVRDRRENKEW